MGYLILSLIFFAMGATLPATYSEWFTVQFQHHLTLVIILCRLGIHFYLKRTRRPPLGQVGYWFIIRQSNADHTWDTLLWYITLLHINQSLQVVQKNILMILFVSQRRCLYTSQQMIPPLQLCWKDGRLCFGTHSIRISYSYFSYPSVIDMTRHKSLWTLDSALFSWGAANFLFHPCVHLFTPDINFSIHPLYMSIPSHIFHCLPIITPCIIFGYPILYYSYKWFIRTL